VSTRNKVLLGAAIYIGLAVLVFVLFGSEGKNEHFKPQNEFKL